MAEVNAVRELESLGAKLPDLVGSAGPLCWTPTSGGNGQTRLALLGSARAALGRLERLWGVSPQHAVALWLTYVQHGPAARGEALLARVWWAVTEHAPAFDGPRVPAARVEGAALLRAAEAAYCAQSTEGVGDGAVWQRLRETAERAWQMLERAEGLARTNAVRSRMGQPLLPVPRSAARPARRPQRTAESWDEVMDRVLRRAG